MQHLVLLILFSLATLLWWIVVPVRAVLHDRKLGVLAAMRLEEPRRWPRVSVLVPAKDEQDTLFDAVQSLLRVDYPDLEIIIIDDRSTDRTGEVAQRLADCDRRIRVLHIEKLPAGWLGKVHALHRGIGLCDGEWLLFTDADIHFSARILKQSIAYCLQRNRGFLALFPEFFDTGLLIGSTQAAFGAMLLSMLDIGKISDPESEAAMGIGAFNLASREFIDTREGLEWLRMEVADDAGLALMMKRRGAAIDLLSGKGLLGVDWYPTLASMMDGVLQRLVMGANYHPGLYLLQCLLVIICMLAPLGLGVSLASWSPLAWLCLSAYLLPSILLRSGVRNIAMPGATTWAIPLGFAIIAYGMLRSLVSCIRRGGIYWRGNVYPLAELRAMQRVKLTAFF